jgi:hypothetical protein
MEGVVAVKVLAGLITVEGDVGAVEVQNNLFWWRVMLIDKVMPEDFMGLDDCLSIHTTLQATQSRLAS